MEKAFHLFPILIILLISATSCKPNPEPLLLSDTTCQPPCWGGITPGETTASEAIEKLKVSKSINPSSVMREHANQFTYPDLLSFSFTDGIKGRLSYSNNIVVDIYFHNLNWPLGDLIQILGYPDQIIVAPYWSKLTIILLYKQKNILLIYNKGESERGKILLQANDLIEEIRYSSIEAFSKILNGYCGDADISKVETSSKTFEDYVQVWKGYGEVNSFLPCFIKKK
jgi:hypothetical protein